MLNFFTRWIIYFADFSICSIISLSEFDLRFFVFFGELYWFFTKRFESLDLMKNSEKFSFQNPTPFLSLGRNDFVKFRADPKNLLKLFDFTQMVSSFRMESYQMSYYILITGVILP